MSKIEWHLEKRFLNELIPHAKNPRIFTDKGLKDLDKSIDKIGMAQPININTDGTILSGHARLLTLKNKGVKEVDVYVPSRELTEKEQEEVLIRMNANNAGEWDFDKLANEWEQLELEDWGLDLNFPAPGLELEDEEPEEVSETQKKLLKCPCCGHVNEAKAFTTYTGNEEDLTNEDTD